MASRSKCVLGPILFARSLLQRWSLSLSLSLSFSAGCLTLNPASHPRRNNAELAVDNGAFYQGRVRIDEQDFYELAGDREAVKKIQSYRRGLLADQLGGQAAGAGGIGGIAVGGGVLAGGIVWTSQSGPIGLLLLLPGALLLTGSIVAVPLGYAEAASSASEMYAPTLPLERAEAAAKRANKKRRGD